ncbi:hypothetical protein BDW42DRAFT_173528 [Aspergillus taichungensis]|uniref:GDP/GTP exchange factor Sec2 N-terminal domain-containing protein n=1 Tax=Aspergillus taichungensis TaxID=482145 RepID=A0A2J5HPQ9_9EURO|nr:hypothetical protein BDW42DRAFT_173528 [Aspergillus taichungensis]
MSTTTTTTALTSTTLVGTLPTMTKATTPLNSGTGCPSCGQEEYLSPGALQDARQRVKDLEGQVNGLNTQATQMAEKLAEYEEEVRRLRANGAPAAYTPTNGSFASSASLNDLDNRSLSPTQPQPQQQQGRLSTLTSFLPYRRSSATPAPQPQGPLSPRLPSPPSPDVTAALQNQLNREQDLRRAAESQLTQAHTELEELTVQLFSQANEMVAQERKARARLEERVAVLERRDVEKRNRLDRLEKAMARVERIRTMVG